MCPHMTGTSTFPLYDAAYAGDLRADLNAWRAEGLTLDQLAARLQAEGVDVSRETVRRWLSMFEEAAS